eukprot:7280772-Prymnesium_polylepis.1
MGLELACGGPVLRADVWVAWLGSLRSARRCLRSETPTSRNADEPHTQALKPPSPSAPQPLSPQPSTLSLQPSAPSALSPSAPQPLSPSTLKPSSPQPPYAVCAVAQGDAGGEGGAHLGAR